MNKKYSFLSDELALIEIRKHKWIESEKQGFEIGFATAACDWVGRYGNDWKKFRLNPPAESDLFVEKRRYRRFAYQVPIELKVAETHLTCCAKDINLIGLSCLIPIFVPHDAPVEVSINLQNRDSLMHKSRFQFKSRIVRVSSAKERRPSQDYEIVLSLSEQFRDYLRCNPYLLSYSHG
ncbi:MAG: PilZ domain-containing protein [Candidatus Omnitrophota bacterium]